MIENDEQNPLRSQNLSNNDENSRNISENTFSTAEFPAFVERQRLHSRKWARWTVLFIKIVLLVSVGILMGVLISNYTEYNHDSSKSDLPKIGKSDNRPFQLRSASIYMQNKSPKELGYINIYIRKSTRDDFRRQSTHFRFPIARYDRHEFPMNGPYLSLIPWVPIFVDRRTYQTIIYSAKEDVFVIPPLINVRGKLYSIGELLYHTYASLVGNGPLSIDAIKISSFFRQEQIYGSDIPTVNPTTGGFIGGIRTNYEHFNIPRRQQSSSDEYSSDEDKEEENKDPSESHPYVIKQNKKLQSRPTVVAKEQNMKQKEKCPSFCDRFRVSNVCMSHSVDLLKRQYLSSKLPEVELDDDDLESENNDSAQLDNCNCQNAILTPSELHEHALFIILHLSKKYDSSVKKACQQLPQLKEMLQLAHSDAKIEATIGIGYATTRTWLTEANVSFPKSFMEYKTIRGPTGKRMPNTGGDLFLDIRSSRKDLCFELGRQFYQLISKKSITRLENTFGFAYMGSKKTGLAKDFIGFEDGNDNPEGYIRRAKAALIAKHDDELVHVGGSFALTQRWRHNLEKWNKNSQEEQENIIGRTKGDGSLEKEPRIPSSHVGRTHIEEHDIEIEIVRKSLPYGDLREHGLFFVAYASNPEKFERLLNSMVGNENGTSDRLMEFTTPITGNYWFIPSLTVLENMFSSNCVSE